MVENACDEKWTSAELAAKCCDTMVAAGKLRATPAFIREDREAKLVKIFEGAKLDGAKVLACKNARELEVIIRNATRLDGSTTSRGHEDLPAADAEGQSWHDGERGGEEGQGGVSDQVSEGRTNATRDRRNSQGTTRLRRLGVVLREGRVTTAASRATLADCPNPPSGQRRDATTRSELGGGPKKCYNCGQLGRISRDCPNAGPGRRLPLWWWSVLRPGLPQLRPDGAYPKTARTRRTAAEAATGRPQLRPARRLKDVARLGGGGGYGGGGRRPFVARATLPPPPGR